MFISETSWLPITPLKLCSAPSNFHDIQLCCLLWSLSRVVNDKSTIPPRKGEALYRLFGTLSHLGILWVFCFDFLKYFVSILLQWKREVYQVYQSWNEKTGRITGLIWNTDLIRDVLSQTPLNGDKLETLWQRNRHYAQPSSCFFLHLAGTKYWANKKRSSNFCTETCSWFLVTQFLEIQVLI